MVFEDRDLSFWCSDRRFAESRGGAVDAALAVCDLLRHTPVPAATLVQWHFLPQLIPASTRMLAGDCPARISAVCRLLEAVVASPAHGNALCPGQGTHMGPMFGQERKQSLLRTRHSDLHRFISSQLNDSHDVRVLAY